MAIDSGPDIVTDGLAFCFDAASNRSYRGKNFIKAKIYSVYNGGARSANYSVQYSDDNSNWTTAFSGVAANNSLCGIQVNSGNGDGSYGHHRYWRYVEGSAVVSHHPRVSRIILTDVSNIDSDLIVYTSDNCSDSGTYIVGTTTATDFGASNWYDLTSNARTGTLTNGPGYNSNNRGSIVFDGSNDYVSIPSATYTLTTGNTMEMWVYLTARDRNQGFMSLNSGAGNYINFWMSSGNTMRWEVIGNVNNAYSTINSSTTFALNTWYHVVGTANLTNTYIYINGVLETSQSMTNQPTSITAVGYIGNYETSYPSASRIAVSRFYNRPLTAAEVLQNFNAQRDRFGI